jgi:hypothetical protein
MTSTQELSLGEARRGEVISQSTESGRAVYDVVCVRRGILDGQEGAEIVTIVDVDGDGTDGV